VSEANKTLVCRLVNEAQGQGKLDVVDEILADDFIDHTPFPGVPPTREGVKMLFGYLRSVFPDLRVTIHEQIADSAKVATRKTFEGTHRGDFMGVPGTGKTITFEVIDILTFNDGGRIAEHRVVFDRMGIQQQLTA
jgi:steroid delta-isomerase-like uncharacterized protein